MTSAHENVVPFRDPILESVLAVARQATGDLPFEVFHAEWGGGGHSRVLRLYIDGRDGGPVGIEDCTQVSRAVSDLLETQDMLDTLTTPYTLEVSSPGVNRILVRRGDFQNCLNKVIKLESLEPISGRKRFHGELVGLNPGSLAVSVDHQVYVVPFNQIKKAKLDYFANENPIHEERE